MGMIPVKSKIFFVLVALFFGAVFLVSEKTFSHFFDRAESKNSFSAGWWVAPSVEISSPQEEGEVFSGEDLRIVWEAGSSDPEATAGMEIGIYYSCENFSEEKVIREKTSNDGNFNWTVPQEEGEGCRVRISATDKHGLTGEGLSGKFSIVSREEIKKGDVVINEVMWMGSEGKPNDQWVELRNISSKKIHLKEFYLTYKKESTGNENKLAEIKDNRILKPGEYFLLTVYKKSTSAVNVNPDDDGLEKFDFGKFRLRLYSSKDKKFLIDEVGDGESPPAFGDARLFRSMQRIDNFQEGTFEWVTCRDENTGSYWDAGRKERGTPGGENIF